MPSPEAIHARLENNIMTLAAKRLAGGLVPLLLVAATQGQPAPMPPDKIEDEFEGSSLSVGWTKFHERYGWPNKIRSLQVGGAATGVLRMEPAHTAWVRDLNGPFLFQTIEGDFDLRARVRMRGRNGPLPAGTWTLGGLIARMPNGLNEKNWQPNRENWHFITTGVAHEPGRSVIETKGTYNSFSSLQVRTVPAGWMELRLVRVGMALFALSRRDARSPWVLRDRFYRMDMSPVTQVGLIAYARSPDVPEGPDNAEVENRKNRPEANVDGIFEVDWIRAGRPAYTRAHSSRAAGRPLVDPWYAQVSGQANRLTDPVMPAAEILRLLGD